MCENSNHIVDGVGYASGIILSICLTPQIYKVIKSKKVNDISYVWQFLYILGLSLHLYYSIFYKLIPIYIPCMIELLFIILLTVLKYIYSRNNLNIEEENKIEK